MPKTEKKLKEDVSSLQQKIKRRTQSPGNPSDVGEWEGAINTKYRNGSFGNFSGYVFEYITSLSFAIPNLWIGILLHTLSFASLCTKETKKSQEEALLIGDSIILVYTPGP
jgi:hypothetical protein